MPKEENTIKISVNEKFLHFFMMEKLRQDYRLKQQMIFREIPIGESVADFVYFNPLHDMFGELTIFELKMAYDYDAQRLARQIKDYLKVADYVEVIGIGDKILDLPETVGHKVYDVDKDSGMFFSLHTDIFKKNKEIDWNARLEVIDYIKKITKHKVKFINRCASKCKRQINKQFGDDKDGR